MDDCCINNVVEALDLILMQAHYADKHINQWDIDYLEEEFEKGIPEFGEACRAVFGAELSKTLNDTLQYAQSCNQHAAQTITVMSSENEIIRTINLAYELAAASERIQEILHNQKCDYICRFDQLTKSTLHWAHEIRRKLDPLGIICPATIVPSIKENCE